MPTTPTVETLPIKVLPAKAVKRAYSRVRGFSRNRYAVDKCCLPSFPLAGVERSAQRPSGVSCRGAAMASLGHSGDGQRIPNILLVTADVEAGTGPAKIARP